MVSSSGCSTLTDVLSSAAAVREFSGSIDSQMDGTGELDGDMKELHGDYIVSERETEGTIDLVVTSAGHPDSAAETARERRERPWQIT